MFVKITDSKIPCNCFCANIKVIPKATMCDMRKGGRDMEAGYSCKGNDNGNIIIKNYYYIIKIIKTLVHSCLMII